MAALLSFAASQGSQAKSFELRAPNTALRFDLPELEKLIEQAIVEAMEKEHIPGAAITLVKDGQIIISRGYGFANLEKQTPVTPDKTIFRIGSITKLLTAHAVVQMADLQKINLNDDVNKYLAQFKVDSRYSEPVRFWHLLTHTAGFDQVGDRGREFAQPEDRKASLSEYLANTLIRIRPPGQVSSYDTWGITLAGHLLERISGRPYAEFMKLSVFKPLKMARANVETPEELKADLAMGYRYQDGKYIPQRYEYYATLPASSIDATVIDMAQYMIAVLGDGSADGRTAFLSKRATEWIRQPQFSNAPGIPAFAYGFFEDQAGSARL
jgi:CubicO group peptidase (beta-lactamase class C family)